MGPTPSQPSKNNIGNKNNNTSAAAAATAAGGNNSTGTATVTWEPDSASNACRLCKGPIGTFNRHHCRECGRLHCSRCCSKTKSVQGYTSPVRVCDACFQKTAAAPAHVTVKTVNAAQPDIKVTFPSATAGETTSTQQHLQPSKQLAAIPFRRDNNNNMAGFGGGASPYFGGASMGAGGGGGGGGHRGGVGGINNRNSSSTALANALLGPVARPIPRPGALDVSGGGGGGGAFGGGSLLRAPMGAGGSLALSPRLGVGGNSMRGPIAMGNAFMMRNNSNNNNNSNAAAGAGQSMLGVGQSLRLGTAVKQRPAGRVMTASPAVSSPTYAAVMADTYAGSLPSAFFARLSDKYGGGGQQQQRMLPGGDDQQHQQQQVQVQSNLSLLQSYVLDAREQITSAVIAASSAKGDKSNSSGISALKTITQRLSSIDNLHLTVQFRGVFRRDHFRTCAQVALDRHHAFHSRLLHPESATASTSTSAAGSNSSNTLQLVTLPQGALLNYSFASCTSETLADLVRGAVFQPFDLSTDLSLFRVHIFEVNPPKQEQQQQQQQQQHRRSEEHVCVFVAHRLVADHRSLGIFFDDVRSLYKHANELVVPATSSANSSNSGPQSHQQCAGAGTEVVLNEAVINRILPPIFSESFTASLQWDRELLSTTEGQELRHLLMASQISGACGTIVEVPTDKTRGSSYGFSTAIYELPRSPIQNNNNKKRSGGVSAAPGGSVVVLSDDVLEALRASFMSQSASLNHGLLAAFGALLLRYTGSSAEENEVPIAVRQDMRPFCSAADAIGPFTNFSVFTARAAAATSSSSISESASASVSSSSTSAAAELTFAELLSAARRHCNDLETRCVPFPALLEKASLSSPGGHFPLAQIGFINYMLGNSSAASSASSSVALSLGLCEDHHHHHAHNNTSSRHQQSQNSSKKRTSSAIPHGAVEMGDVIVTTPTLIEKIVVEDHNDNEEHDFIDDDGADDDDGEQEEEDEGGEDEKKMKKKKSNARKLRTKRVALPRSSMFDLLLHLWEDAGSSTLRIAFEYNTNLFQLASVQRLAESFAELLNDIARRGVQQPVLSYSVLSVKQRHQLLFAFNNNPLQSSRDEQRKRRGVHALVEDAAAKFGDRVAITMPEVTDKHSNGNSNNADSLAAVALCRPTITYSELDKLSNQFARFLRTRFIDTVVSKNNIASNNSGGGQSDFCIAVCMPRCTLQFVAVLSILKSGAAYLPLDLSYPADRLDFMLGDSTALCVITSRSVCDGPLGELFVARGTPAVVAEEVTTCSSNNNKNNNSNNNNSTVAEVLSYSSEPLKLSVDPDNLAYVIYTSGSTGKPKGVEMRHGALTNLILWQNDYLPPRPEHAEQVSLTTDGGVRTLQFSPISFDVSFQETFSTWSLGGTMVMVSEQLRLDPRRLVRCLNESRVHRIFLPFVALSHICDMFDETGELPKHLTDIITAGEQLVITRSVVNFFNALRVGHSSKVEPVLHNHYGPSESHVCSYAVLRGDPTAWVRLPPIGVPISNTQLYVLDDAKQLVPLGVTGELYIGGDCLGRGYLGRPELVAKTFVPVGPLNLPSATSSRLYKTGDLVRMVPNGDILYVRRKDFQVKIRGFRIELGEIEARLSQHAQVQKCCVEVRGSGSADKKIVAYLITSAAHAPDAAAFHSTTASAPLPPLTKKELKEHLRATLPDYMIPSCFMFMRVLPLTPSGKIDRKNLPQPSAAEFALEVGGPLAAEILHLSSNGSGTVSSPTGSTVSVAPSTPTEETVSRIWRDVLSLQPATALCVKTASFFSVGGHSLSVAKMLARVFSQLHVEVPVSFAFQHPTVSEIATEVDRILQLRKTLVNSSIGGSSGDKNDPNQQQFVPLGEAGIVYVPRALMTSGGPGGPGGNGSGPVHSSVVSIADSTTTTAHIPYDARYPLTLNQQSLVYLSMTMPRQATAIYNISMAGELRKSGIGSSSSSSSTSAMIEHLRDAFNRVLQRYPALRTTFHVDDEEGGTGELFQVVHEAQDLDFGVVELEAASSLVARSAAAAAAAAAEEVGEAGMYGPRESFLVGSGGAHPAPHGRGSTNSAPAFINSGGDSFVNRLGLTPSRPSTGGGKASPATASPTRDTEEQPSLFGQVLADEETIERMRQEACRPFNLARDSMMRVRIYCKNSSSGSGSNKNSSSGSGSNNNSKNASSSSPPPPPRVYLQVVFHHIVTDLWSIVLIVEALQAALSRRPLPPPSPATATMIDFARYLQLRQRQAAPRMLEQWKSLLRIKERPLPVLDLPTDFPEHVPTSSSSSSSAGGKKKSGNAKSYRGGVRSFHFTPQLSEELKAAAKATGNTMYSVLLSIVAIALHKFSRQEEIVLGTPLANRHVQEFEDTVGYFINPCPMPVEVAPDMTIAELLQKSLKTVHSVMDLQEYPFPTLADRLDAAAAAAHYSHHGAAADSASSSSSSSSTGSIFRAMFIYQQPHRLSEEITPFFLHQDGNPLPLTTTAAPAGATTTTTTTALPPPPLPPVATAAAGAGRPTKPATRGGGLFGAFGGATTSTTTTNNNATSAALPSSVLSSSSSSSFSGDLTWYSIAVPTHLAMYDLVAQFGEATGGRVCGCIEYNSDLFHPAVIESLASVIEVITEQIVSALEQRTTATTTVAKISTTSPAMADWIISETNRHPQHTQAAVRGDGNNKTMMLAFGDVYVDLLNTKQTSFVWLFRRVAARYGNRTAVDFTHRGHEVTLTFEQLDRLSDALAVRIVAVYHEQQQHKKKNNTNNTTNNAARSSVAAGPASLLHGAFVGVALRRGPLLIVAEIAVLKAGGAFIPLDPSYPEDRLRHMMSDSSAPLIICTPEDARTEKFQAVVSAIASSSTSSSDETNHDDDDNSVGLALLEIAGIEELEQKKPDQQQQPQQQTAAHAASFAAVISASHDHITGDDRAYAIYTSGSTGKPKGVVLCHRGLVHLGYSIRHGYLMSVQESRMLLFASPSFDASVLEIFVPLANACAVVILSPDAIVGDSLARAMAEARVTHAVLPPAVLAGMAEDCFPSAGLKVLITAGEAIPAEVLSRWRNKIYMLNAYGPTENTVASTICDYNALRVFVADRAGEQLQSAVQQAAACGGAVVKAPPIGRCIPNTRCYIVDSCLRPCAVGVPGELVCTGPGVAIGYHKLPQKTNECFLQNPFVSQQQQQQHDVALFGRMYKTGDLVRWSPAFFHSGGAIEFAGRIDQQVKIRGYRIELGEIESALMRINGVAEAAVAVKDVPRAGKTLVAYFVAAHSSSSSLSSSSPSPSSSCVPSSAEMRQQLRQTLPDYMVPAVFVPLVKLPLSPSGKIDRNALPTPDSVVDPNAGANQQQSNASGDCTTAVKEMPHTPLEITIATLFAEVLGGGGGGGGRASSVSGSIGIHDNFFEIGGHSLSAMQLVSRLKEHTGVDVPIIKIFEAPTVAALADVVRSAAGDAAATITIKPKSSVAMLDADDNNDEDMAMDIENNSADQALQQQQNELMLHKRSFTLSYNQEALWFAYLHDKSSSALNVNFTAKLSHPSRFDLAAFVVALACVKAVHPTLRVVFSSRNGHATQSFTRNCFPTLAQRRYETEDELKRLIEEDAHVPHSLEHGVFVVYLYHQVSSSSIKSKTGNSNTAGAAGGGVADVTHVKTTQDLHRQRHLLNLSPETSASTTHFTLAFHHIVMDLSSIELVVEQLRDFYSCISTTTTTAMTTKTGEEDQSGSVDPNAAWMKRLAASIVAATSSNNNSKQAAAAASSPARPHSNHSDSSNGNGADAKQFSSPSLTSHASLLPSNFATEVRSKVAKRVIRACSLPSSSSSSSATESNDVVSSVSYIDFAEWQREVFQSQAGEQLAAYWQRHLLGAPTESTVKLDKPRPSNGQPRSLEGGTVLPQLPPDFSQTVGEGARALGTTVATLLLSTTVAWMNRVTGQTDLIVGMPVAGRTRQELESIVGDFVNVLPIRVELPTATTATTTGSNRNNNGSSSAFEQHKQTGATAASAVAAAAAFDEAGASVGSNNGGASPASSTSPTSATTTTTTTNATFRQVLRLTKTSLLKGLMHQEYPFSLMVEKFCAYRDAGKSPLFQILFVHEKPNNRNAALAPFVVGDAGGKYAFGSDARGEGGEGMQLLSVESSEKQCQFDIVIAVSEGPGGSLGVRLQYASSLLMHETAVQLAQQWVNVTLAAVAAPNSAVHNISLLSPAQQLLMEQKTLNRRNNIQYAGVTKMMCAHELFEAQSDKTPSAVAVFEENGTRLSYEQLNKQANALAHELREKIIVPALEENEKTQEPEHDDDDDDDESAPLVVVDPAGSPTLAPIAVAILMRRSPSTVLAMIAASKAGATYVPLDMKAPVERLLYIVRDSGAKVILFHNDTKTTLEALIKAAAAAAAGTASGTAALPVTINVDEFVAQENTNKNVNNLSRIKNNVLPSFYAPLYIIYTSGSTGNPKGVVVHHGGLVAVASWFVHEHCVQPGDISAQSLGAAFDPVNIEIWPYLFAGAAVTFMDDNTKLAEPQTIVDWLHTQRVTHITFPTVLSARIFAEGQFPAKGFAMKSWSCGGDKFAGTRRALSFAVFNAYGPTEASVLCSQYCVNFEKGVAGCDFEHGMQQREPDSSRRSVDPPIGVATANTALYVLDEYDRLCPPGTVGELCVAGAQVAIGYHNNSVATSKSFVADPVAVSGAEYNKYALRMKRGGRCNSRNSNNNNNARLFARMYRTGDLVRYDGEFNLHFVGRKDFQVKIRGFRIELGEIETQLLQLGDSAVIGAQVVVYEGPKTNGEKRLFAFVIPAAASSSDLFAETNNSKNNSCSKSKRSEIRLQLRKALKARLPEYMIPVLVLLPKFPLTANGKPDRALLLKEYVPSMEDEAYADDAAGGGGGGSQEDKQPRNEVEAALCKLWCDVLGVKSVSPTDNWYSRGGSSLTSTVLISKVKQLFDIVVTLQQFFADTTVRGLAKVIGDGGRTAVVDNIAETLAKDAATMLDAGLKLHQQQQQAHHHHDNGHLNSGNVMSNRGAAGDEPEIYPFDPDAEPTGIFITGVTGFLGAFLAYELLRETSATLYCLVRAHTEAEGLRRIYENFVRYKLMKPHDDASADAASAPKSFGRSIVGAAAPIISVSEFERRIVPLIGDLGRPNFGLSEQRFQDVAALTQHIIHCGAFVNFGYPYSSLKNANVDGTVTALRLATTVRLKAVHHISTLSVLPDPDDATSRAVTERRLPAAPSPHLHGGYTQSKWVAEQLVWKAFAEHGVPVTVHRPGRITGHSVTGATNNDDFLNLFVKGCLEMRAVPVGLVMPCELTPVDFCAQAIVRCSLRHPRAALEGHCFHITNPSSVPWAKFFDIMRREASYTSGMIQEVPTYSAWREQHLLKLTGESHNALLPLVPSFGADFEAEAAPMDYKVDAMMRDFNDAECLRRVLNAALDFVCNAPVEVQQAAPSRMAAAETIVLMCGASAANMNNNNNGGAVAAAAGDATKLRSEYPPTNEELVRIYARYFVAEKFFPPPPSNATTQ